MVSILLPGILVYVMYSFMGSAMGSNFGVDEDYVPTVQAVDLPASMPPAFTSNLLTIPAS